MKVIDCPCGETVQAANDDDLTKVVREHLQQRHAEPDASVEQARALVEERAYEAMDA